MVKSQVGPRRVQTKKIISLQREISGEHHLEFSKFSRPKKCCVCNDSIARHGLHCAQCRFCVHEKCELHMPNSCRLAPLKANKSAETLPTCVPLSK